MLHKGMQDDQYAGLITPVLHWVIDWEIFISCASTVRHSSGCMTVHRVVGEARLCMKTLMQCWVMSRSQ